MTDREMIIAAAEKILGWNYWDGLADYDITGRTYFTDWGFDDLKRVDVYENGSEDVTRQFDPLGRIQDAFMLVDALRLRKMAFVLGSNGCSAQVTAWFVDGIWSLGLRQNQVPEHGDPHLRGCYTAEAAPRAITVAALRAVGVDA